jgi:hypothetical protein
MEPSPKLCRQFNSPIASPNRLVYFAAPGKNSGNDQSAENETDHLDPKNYPNLSGYQQSLDAAKAAGEISEAEYQSRLKAAEKNFENTKKQEAGQNLGAIIEKIQKARDEKQHEKIGQSAVEQLKLNYLKNFEELRNFIRQELADLGIPFQSISPNSKEFDEFIKFEESIMKHIHSLLDSRKHQEIMNEVEAEKKLAKRCWQRINALFTDSQKLHFIKLLRLKEIPVGADGAKTNVRGNIEDLFKLHDHPTWAQAETLMGVSGPELFTLDKALNAIERLYKNWAETKPDDKSRLQWRINEHEKTLDNLKSETEEIGTMVSDVGLKLFLANWKNFHTACKNDLAQLRNLLADKEIETDTDARKLITAFLNGSDAELKKLSDEFKQIREEKAAEKKDKEKAGKPPKPDDKGPKKPALEQEAPLPAGTGHKQHKKDIFGKIHDAYMYIMTADDRITWYSAHDILGAFKLIKKAWEHHIESESEDKAGKLGKKVMFWHAQVEKRIHLDHLASEQSRASELVKTFKHYDYDELVARLAERPARDHRRAILETIADRGNLRMSDRKLVNIICPGVFNEANWKFAEMQNDFTPMREAFKLSIDNHFIGQPNYGAELIDRHNAGLSKAAEMGKKHSSSAESGSAKAEMGMFNIYIKKTQMEGEGVVSGIIAGLVDRGNVFSGSGGFNTAELNIEGKNIKKRYNSDMGLVGLLLTDAFLKGKVSRELLGNLGKSNEQVFRPFACFQDVLAMRTKTDPITREKICSLEYWGWIDEKRHTITELGKTELPKFFNTRNATAQIKQSDGKYIEKTIHMGNGLDSSLTIHANRITSTRDALNGVNDKFLGYVAKAAGINIYELATQLRHDTGASQGAVRETASLIKAGVEEFLDGAEIVSDPSKERVFDKFGENKELDPETGRPLDDYGKPDLTKDPVPEERRIKVGASRMEKGEQILTRILYNMWLYREDREITTKQTPYVYINTESAENGLPNEKDPPKNLPLQEYLEKSLAKYAHTPGYRKIMAALRRLNDPSQQLTRKEIEFARSRTQKADISNKADIERAMKSKNGQQFESSSPYASSINFGQ